MRNIQIFALAIGNVGGAQSSTTTHLTSATTSAIETSTPTVDTEALDAAGGIGNPDGFNFLGCFSSDRDFPSFTQAYSSKENDAYLCAETCLNANFFSLYNNKCYCSNELDLTTSPSVSTDQCDIACPGDANVSCGGLAAGSRVIRRQAALNVLLSVYVAASVSAGETGIIVKTDFAIDT
ncbi:hypothetical protein H9Q69_011039 [Fusarium xylarioides]|nr:hypothetical protein H9Q69_011039 [Fusarium xylarioides]